MKRIAYSGIALTMLLAMAGVPAGAQDQPTSSLGDYARQVRKTSSPNAKPKVFDNDNLPQNDKLSVVGKAPAAGEQPSEAKKEESTTSQNSDNKPGAEAKPGTTEKPAAADAANPANEQAAKEAAWKHWSEQIAQQKDQIDLMNRELDVLQREYQIRAAAMYADVGNRLRNSTDWDKQDAQYKQQIADKQKAVEDAKQKLDDLQEEARKAGVPSSVREP